jgi:hypothetical protein
MMVAMNATGTREFEAFSKVIDVRCRKQVEIVDRIAARKGERR